MEQELRGVNLEEAFQTLQQGIFFGDINQTNDINRFHKVRELSLLFEKKPSINLITSIVAEDINTRFEDLNLFCFKSPHNFLLFIWSKSLRFPM